MYLRNSLKQLFSGRDVRIFGSAPSGPLLDDLDALNVFVNGAIGRCEEVEGTKIGFVNEQLLSVYAPDNWTVKKTIELIIENSSKLHLLIVSPSNPYFADRKALRAIECKVIRIGLASSHRRMARTLKSKYLPSFPNGMVSTGIRAVVMAFSFGAKSVNLVGFSLRVPEGAHESHHFYDPVISDSAQKPRHHASADSAALAILSLQGKEIQSDVGEFSILFHHFGGESRELKGSYWPRLFQSLLFRGLIPDLFISFAIKAMTYLNLRSKK